MHYELPDGKTVPVGPQRFQVPDILMNPEPVMGMLTGTTPATTFAGDAVERAGGGLLTAVPLGDCLSVVRCAVWCVVGDEAEWSRESVPKMLLESVFRCERDQVPPTTHCPAASLLRTGSAFVPGASLMVLPFLPWSVQQAQLISSVVVAGGGACVEGTMERLKLEVETALAGQSQVREGEGCSS